MALLNSSLPDLKWNEYNWEAPIILDTWAGFQSRKGPYNSKDSDLPSNGSLTLRIHADNEIIKPSLSQIKAFEWSISHQSEIQKIILQGLLTDYLDHINEWFLSGDQDPPIIQSIADFTNIVGLSFLHISKLELNNIAYTGYEFGCEWDEEHSLGILMHGNRIVEIGGADTCFLGWNAENDKQKHSATTK